MSNLTHISYSKFVQNRLSYQEKRRADKKMNEFHLFGEKHDIRFSTLCPTTSMGIDELLLTLQPYGYKVLAIDYLSLLDDASRSNKDEWKVLRDVSARCKTYSRHNKCLIILLAQLDEETDKLRYAKGVRENADVFWFWNYSKETDRNNQIIPVKVGKARDGRIFGFELGERFDIMTVDNLENMDKLPPQPSYDDDLDKPRPPKAKARFDEDESDQPRKKKAKRDDFDDIDDSNIVELEPRRQKRDADKSKSKFGKKKRRDHDPVSREVAGMR
jgi:hypothetical protein